MGQDAKKAGPGRKIRSAAALIGLTVVLLTSTARPARAIIVNDPALLAETITSWALDFTNWATEQARLALNGFITGFTGALGLQGQSYMFDTLSTNINTTAKFQMAAQIQMEYARHSNFSYCHTLQSTLTSSNNDKRDDAMVQAFTQANQNALADETANSKIMLNECTLCFAPVYPPANGGPQDPEYSVFRSFGCQPCPAANGQPAGVHERADRNIAAVLGPDQYLVPPNFPKQLMAGVYQPTPKPPDDKYTPFLAAYTACQRLVPLKNPVIQVAQGSPPPLGGLKMGQSMREDMQSSDAATQCMRALVQRMQFDNTTTNWPAGNPQPNKTSANLPNGIVTAHDEQFAQCDEEHANNQLDDAHWQDCKVNGRSSLQALHDSMFQNGQASFLIDHVATATAVSGQNMIDHHDPKGEWKELKRKEAADLAAAMSASSPAPGSTNWGSTEQNTR